MKSTSKIRLFAIGILLLALAMAFFDVSYQANSDDEGSHGFSLGLDLQGGAHLIYGIDTTSVPSADKDEAVAGVRDVIERRVNSFGVSEPNVQSSNTPNGTRLIVELAGVSDISTAITMIGETPLLEFLELDPEVATDELTEEQQKSLENYNTDALNRAEGLLVKAKSADQDFSELAREFSEDSGSAVLGGSLGFVPRGVFAPEFETSCFDLGIGAITNNLVKTDFGYHIIKKDDEREQDSGSEANCRHILISTQSAADYLEDQFVYTGLTGQHLKRAQVQFDQHTSVPNVSLEFNEEGQNLFAEITGRNVGQPVAIYLDGSPISTPVVQQQITQGNAVITGNFTVPEARQLVRRLNAGALPLPIVLISQQTVGASLGQISIIKSLRAAYIGLLLLGIFMVLFYRLPGLLAVLALLVYASLVLATFKIIPITLTLAGIAGFLLSLGMAVDANVLIFERLKEELRSGKLAPVAISEAFRRAWPSIRDGNISTLITCFILMTFSTSIVQGFAVTLAVGIIFSMLTAVIVTKVLLRLIEGIDPNKYGWLGLGLKNNSQEE